MSWASAGQHRFSLADVHNMRSCSSVSLTVFLWTLTTILARSSCTLFPAMQEQQPLCFLIIIPRILLLIFQHDFIINGFIYLFLNVGKNLLRVRNFVSVASVLDEKKPNFFLYLSNYTNGHILRCKSIFEKVTIFSTVVYSNWQSIVTGSWYSDKRNCTQTCF